MNPIYNPMIPFNGLISGGMVPGRIIRIQGVVPHSSHKFAINLLYGLQGDIALHVSPHFSSHHVVRNSVINRSWGHEEKHGGLPIHPGQPFSIIIICEQHQYKIAFNDHHFAEFNHRLPFNGVTNLAIDGEVSVHQISFEGGAVSGGFMASAPLAPFSPYPGGGAHLPHQGHIPPHQGHVPPHQGHVPPHQGYVPPHPPSYPHQAGQVPYVAHPVQPGYPSHSAYPQQPGYPVHGSPHAMPSSGYPHSPTGHKKSGLLDKAGMAVAGALGGASLLGGKKAMKQQKKAHKKALKYGLPIAGVGLGAYALHKVGHHHHHHRSSSSSSSSSSD